MLSPARISSRFPSRSFCCRQRFVRPLRRTDIKCFASGVAIKFVIPYHCRFGQHLCLVGSVDKLGKWDVSKGVEMVWYDGDVWKADVDIPVSSNSSSEDVVVEYKYVVRNGDRTSVAQWAPGYNHKLSLPLPPAGMKAGSAIVHVHDTWDGSDHKVEVHDPSHPQQPKMEAVNNRPAGLPLLDKPSSSPPAPLAQPSTTSPGVNPAGSLAGSASAPATPSIKSATAAKAVPPASAMGSTESTAPRQPAASVQQPSLQQRRQQPPPQQTQQQQRAPAFKAESSRTKRRGRPRVKPLAPEEDEANAALAAITRESERAMQQLDTAIGSSWELLDRTEDPADPQLLAADRMLAAASQRAAAMSKALDAAAAQRLIGENSSMNQGGSGGQQGRQARRQT